jgi:hypothetical protein
MTKRLEHTVEVHAEPESWHRHTPEEGLPQQEHAGKVNTTILLGVFVAIVVFVAGAILFTYLYFSRYMVTLRREKIETMAMAEEFNAYRARATAELEEYGWVDPQAGVVRLPLDVAKARVLAAYGAK